jgi:hypothetical protein
MMAFVFLLLDDAKNKYDAAATGHRLSLFLSLSLCLSLSLSLSLSLILSFSRKQKQGIKKGRPAAYLAITMVFVFIVDCRAYKNTLLSPFH